MPPSADSSSVDPPVTPVILCGGAGTRLWPAATPDRPKPFTVLVGERSGFHDALARAVAIARGSRILVLGAAANRGLIEAEAAALAPVDLLLEPDGRGSAAAIAAAAVVVAERDPEAILAVLSADHHVDDLPDFMATVAAATRAAAGGAVVTLGVRPTAPLTGFGYIRPGNPEGETSPVLAFVEKPDADTAVRFVEDGYLWNSGMFIARARTLLTELENFAPDVLECARCSVEEGDRDAGGALRLGPAFLRSPNTSIDYAVMERTTLARVVPAGFGWADLGAWDAVWTASHKDDRGNAATPGAVLLESENVLAVAYGGVKLGVVGLRDVAVVSTPEATLVCAMDRGQAVRAVAEQMSAHPRRIFADLAEAIAWFDRWMRTSALPLWWAIGADHSDGGFHERMTLDGRPTVERRRLHVQARQLFVFASAGLAGWIGPWREAASHGLDEIVRHYQRPDGLYASRFDPADGSRSEEASTYDQASLLLALAATRASSLRADEATAISEALVEALQKRRAGPGVYREIGADAFQATANMHLFEAQLAWAALTPARWAEAADELGAFALDRFFDRRRGLIRERFESDWRPRSGDRASLMEPGRQFEWACLFQKWGERRGAKGAVEAAQALFRTGERGVDPERGVALDLLNDDFSILEAGASLWSQAERLRAARTFGKPDEALDALHVIRTYLDTPVPGLWRDKQSPSGAFVQEPAPASSLYPLMRAWRSLGD